MDRDRGVFGCPLKGQELNSMVLGGPFPLGTFLMLSVDFEHPLKLLAL